MTSRDSPRLAVHAQQRELPHPHGRRAINGTQWCLDSGGFFSEYQAAVTSVLDKAEGLGMAVVLSTDVDDLEEPWWTEQDRNAAQDCIRDWIRDTVIPARPQHVLVDNLTLFRDYRTKHGDAAHLGLYTNCSAHGVDYTAGDDCVHPERTTPNSLGDIGKDVLAHNVARGIRHLLRRRLGVQDPAAVPPIPAALRTWWTTSRPARPSIPGAPRATTARAVATQPLTSART